MTVLQVQCVGSKSHTIMRHEKTKYLFVDVLGTLCQKMQGKALPATQKKRGSHFHCFSGRGEWDVQTEQQSFETKTRESFLSYSRSNQNSKYSILHYTAIRGVTVLLHHRLNTAIVPDIDPAGNITYSIIFLK